MATLSPEQYQEIVDKELKELKEKINNFKKEGETKWKNFGK